MCNLANIRGSSVSSIKPRVVEVRLLGLENWRIDFALKFGWFKFVNKGNSLSNLAWASDLIFDAIIEICCDRKDHKCCK